MATVSFTTNYIFDNQGAQKLVEAMEKSEHTKVNRVEIHAKRLKHKKELESFMEKVEQA
ncbi:hypothetical protein [Staphylococcus rostri]|uniref:hypothetical protein n=1 Tax=Staphylococcus rostri TaxID=522262 RepID=UPI001475F222|nr:hypothetical protein [Staphylococcus rostri]